MEEKQIFSNPKIIYQKMISDIRRAKREILLETYIYSDDKIGRLFRDELMKKAIEGVKIRVLIDGWGTEVKKKYFDGLTNLGGEVRFFREFKYTWSFFDDNHERNHRKLLIIDGKVSYIGSINITIKGINWSELVLRMRGNLGLALRKSFNRSWKRFNLRTRRRMKKIVHEGYEVLQGFPSNLGQSSFERRYRKLIRNAKKEIFIETPYFVPSIGIRRVLRRALSRGVKVKLILPRKSDIWIVDKVRNRYLGLLYKAGAEIHYYPEVLHSKLLVIDNSFFLFGSSNLDYRSFLHQYEINLLGGDPELIEKLKKHFKKNLNKSSKFSYGAWKNRRKIGRLVEKVIEWFKEYL